MSNTPLVRWLQLVSMLVLSVGAWSIASPAGAQGVDGQECGTYGPACPTSSSTGGDSGTAGATADGTADTGSSSASGTGGATGDGSGDTGPDGPDGAAAPAGDTRNCTEIGLINIPASDPLYRLDLDDNQDGIACEGFEPGGTSSAGGASSAGAQAGNRPTCPEIGRKNILASDADYHPGLDSNGNGIGCEDDERVGTPAANVGAAAQSPSQSSTPGELGRTGTSASTIALVAAAVVLLGSAIVLGARRRGQNAA